MYSTAADFEPCHPKSPFIDYNNCVGSVHLIIQSDSTVNHFMNWYNLHLIIASFLHTYSYSRSHHVSIYAVISIRDRCPNYISRWRFNTSTDLLFIRYYLSYIQHCKLINLQWFRLSCCWYLIIRNSGA